MRHLANGLGAGLIMFGLACRVAGAMLKAGTTGAEETVTAFAMPAMGEYELDLGNALDDWWDEAYPTSNAHPSDGDVRPRFPRRT